MREQSASIDFTKWPLSKVTNCPNNILAATAGGLIIRKHSPKTLTSALRLFPCPRATATTAEQHILAEGAFPSAHIYHPLEQHKIFVATAAPPNFEQDTHLFSSLHS